MFKFQELINKHKDDLALSVTMEQGKTIADAHGDVFRGLGEAQHRTRVAMLNLCDTNNVLFAEPRCITRYQQPHVHYTQPRRIYEST